jgi:hypothetical protein
MQRFRKKHTIEAKQWFKFGDHPAVVQVPSNHPAWNCPEQAECCGWLKTLEGGNDGAQMVHPGDWIATGIQGEHWPIKPDIFAATYEAAPIPPGGEAVPPTKQEAT